ncbi:Nucleolar protein 9 [Umbelopsis sp. WA50703]
MPRDKRQGRTRGKKGKKEKDQEEVNDTGFENADYNAPMEVDAQQDPNGYQQDPNGFQQDSHNFERPRGYDPSQAFYGFLDADVQQYFKNVEQTLDDPPFETGQDQQLFVANVYSEVESKELILATDHSCSMVLEKLLKISSDFELRVFMDRLTGRYAELFTHRFASHVCQTLLTLSADIVEREARGESIPGPNEEAEKGSDVGVLLSMEQLVLSLCKELKPQVCTLISDQFASHVIRVLLYVLAGKRIDEENDVKGQLRSKKSQKYRNTNNNKDIKASTKASPTRVVPASFKSMLEELTRELTSGLSETVVRTLAVHRVANPVLQLLLELQNDVEEGQKVNDMLVDRILWGIVTDETPGPNSDRDAWFETLLRDQVGSHLLEVVLKTISPSLYNKIFVTYFRNRLVKLCHHPVANFVVQQLFVNARTSVQLELMVEETVSGFADYLKFGKVGVIRSLVDACVRLKACEKQVVAGLCDAFGTHSPTERKDFVNCVIRMWPYQQWIYASDEEKASLKKFHLQGSLIIQTLMKLPEEHNNIVVSSFLAQPSDVTYRWIFDATGSRVYESILASPNTNLKIKKKILRNLDDKYHEISMDKFGSHIMDQCWKVADIDMKAKIAQDLVNHEYELSKNFFGKYILRNCNIDHFKRKREEWEEKEKGIERKKEMFKDIIGDAALISSQPAGANIPANPNLQDLGFGDGVSQETSTASKDKKKKKKKSVNDHSKSLLIDGESQKELEGGMDDIDKVFKKKKSGSKSSSKKADEETTEDHSAPDMKNTPKDLLNVLDAIDATNKSKSKKKRSKDKDSDEKKQKKKRKFEA